MSRLRRWWRARAPEPATSVRSRNIDGVPLAVRTSLDTPSALLRGLDSILAGHPAATEPPVATLTVLARSDGYAVRADRSEPTTFHDHHVLIHHIEDWLAETSLDLATTSHRDVRLHAAGFTLDDRTFVIVGASKSGKTSLTFDALTRGASYLSDERVSVSSGDVGVVVGGLNRPLHVRLGPSELAAVYPATTAFLVDSTFRTLVPHRAIDALGGSITQSTVRPTDLLILTDDPVVRTTTGGPSPGWATLQLVAASMDAVRAGARSMTVLAELAIACSIEVRRPRSLRSVTELRPTTGCTPGHVRPLEPRAGGTAPWTVTDGCSSVAVSDEVVIWVHADRPRLALLREERAAWWRDLVESGGPKGVPPDGLVAELVALGALAPAEAS